MAIDTTTDPTQDQPPSPMAAKLLAAIQANIDKNSIQANATPAPTQQEPYPIPPIAQQAVTDTTQPPLPQSISAPVPPSVPQATPLPASIAGPGMVTSPMDPNAPAMSVPVPASDAAPAASKPGPLKSLLQSFLSGASEAALHHAGLPTAYDRSQTAAQLGIQQQAANDMSAFRQAQTGGLQAKADQLDAQNQPYTFGKDDAVPASLQGQTFPAVVAQGLLKVLAQNKGKLDNTTQQGQNRQDALDTTGQNALSLEAMKQQGGNPRDHQFRSVNGQIVLVNKRDGSVVKNMGADTSTITPNIRAQANAQYGTAQVLDADGNPKTVSRLDQLRSGAPTVTEKAAQTLAGDNIGVDTYRAANKTVRDNLYVLQDPVQRGIIARATEEAERNPGAIDSIVNSYIQQGLSPQGAKLVASLKQMSEFGSTFKKYTGNGGSSTDSLRSTIKANQPSTANSMAVNMNLLNQDDALAQKVGQTLQMPKAYTVPGKNPAPSAPPAPAAPNNLPSWDRGMPK